MPASGMQCDQVRELISAHIDGELAGPDAQAVADHLVSCSGCEAMARDFTRIGRQIAIAGRQTAPRGLEASLRSALAEAERTREKPDVEHMRDGPAAERGVPTVVARADVSHTASPPRAVSRRGLATLMQQAAALAGVAIVASGLTWGVMERQAGRGRLEGEVVTAHIRSLLLDAPVQVASSDSHTVKPWFAGRIDFAPDVKDLAAEGFPLAGGRVDYLGDRRVGALVYRRRLHLVNVFTWPAPSTEHVAVRELVSKGFNVVTWAKNGITYWAVSDLNLGELRQLQSLM